MVSSALVGVSDGRGGLGRRLVAATLGVPLPVKLIGASSAALAIAAVVFAFHPPALNHRWVITAAFILALAVNMVLVWLALHPVRELSRVAEAIAQGQWGSRVRSSVLADRRISRAGLAINQVLDEVQIERSRTRSLARRVMREQDEERSRIARDLHDSTAQTLTAVTLQLSAAARDCTDGSAKEKLADVRELLGRALEEVRATAHGLYPRVLEDLGLVAALTWLARSTSARSGLVVHVIADESVPAAGSDIGAALYRVAQEGVQNAERHGNATHVSIALTSDEGHVTMVVKDDGRGFDVDEAAARGGMGLFSMRDRMSLVGGTLQVESTRGRGTIVTAAAPLQPPGMSWQGT